MKKKKILSLCLAGCLAATAVVSGTLAYFTDTDVQTNTFTTGNVAIDLWEEFGDNDVAGLEELIPAVSKTEGNITTINNAITKEVNVTNTGSEDAYVRVHIAIPSELEGYITVVSENDAEGKWDWTNSEADSKYARTEAIDNAYYTTVSGITYHVYVVTYGTALKKDECAYKAISQVYLNSNVTNEDVASLKQIIGDEWKIYVAAEAIQAAGFDNAYDALNTGFGTPTATGYEIKVNWAGIISGAVTAENKKWGWK